MLDARTTIRNFRDLQFDLRVLLDGIRSLENGNSLVTLKWSDGSVDKIPTYEMLKDYLGNAFRTVLVGDPDNGASMVSDNGLVIGGKLASKITSLVDASIVFSNCTIGDIQAELVTLGQSVDVKSFGLVSILQSIVLTAYENLTFGRLETDKLNVNILDCSVGTHEVEHVYSDTRRYPLDSYLSLLRSGEFHSHMVVDGFMKTYDPSTLAHTYTEVTVYAPYIEGGGPFTQFPVSAGTEEVPEGEYPRLGAVNLSLLYPYRQFGNTSNTRATLTYRAPREDDQYKVVTVRNVSQYGIRACNVWAFSQDTYSGVRRVRISPVNHVNLPPYSAIDFIFSFTYTNDTLNAYMLPTKVTP